MLRDQWCAQFSDEVAIADPAVPRALALRVAGDAYALARGADPREMAVVWLAWRKPGDAAAVAPAAPASPGEADDPLAALFRRLGEGRG